MATKIEITNTDQSKSVHVYESMEGGAPGPTLTIEPGARVGVYIQHNSTLLVLADDEVAPSTPHDGTSGDIGGHDGHGRHE